MASFTANMFTYRGDLYALLVAFFWAISSIIYSRLGKNIQPRELNLLKGVLAGAFVIITLAITNSFHQTIEPVAAVLLLLSGALGIGVGDTAYLDALRTVGPRTATLLKIIAPPTAAILAWIFLGEKLSPYAWAGLILISIGVAWVITERKTDNDETTIQVSKNERARGIFMGLSAGVLEAAGVVLSHAALTRTTITPLWGTLLRLIAGVAVAGILVLFNRQKVGQWVHLPDAKRIFAMLLVAVFFATFLGIVLQQLALQIIPAGIAQTLIATSPLFVLLFALFMGEKISLRAGLGSLIAVVGVALIFLPL
jgi:drug/metabolite transporter (DMT)-like permease